MSIITGLTAGKGRDKRVRVYLDGRLAFSLSAEVALKEGLHAGQEMSETERQALAGADRYQKCLDAAFRLLAVRPRSQDELRQRLKRRGFENSYVEKAIAGLKEKGLVDDSAFASYWKENRRSFRPRSRRLTALELKRKGVDSAIIDAAISELDDGESAYRAALGRARRLALSDFDVFRRRLGDYLVRRGFDYETIQQTVSRLWSERVERPENIRR
jgi:regulatory protein